MHTRILVALALAFFSQNSRADTPNSILLTQQHDIYYTDVGERSYAGPDQQIPVNVGNVSQSVSIDKNGVLLHVWTTKRTPDFTIRFDGPDGEKQAAQFGAKLALGDKAHHYQVLLLNKRWAARKCLYPKTTSAPVCNYELSYFTPGDIVQNVDPNNVKPSEVFVKDLDSGETLSALDFLQGKWTKRVKSAAAAVQNLETDVRNFVSTSPE